MADIYSPQSRPMPPESPESFPDWEGDEESSLLPQTSTTPRPEPAKPSTTMKSASKDVCKASNSMSSAKDNHQISQRSSNYAQDRAKTDYDMQLKLLEYQNRNRLAMARKEEENILPQPLRGLSKPIHSMDGHQIQRDYYRPDRNQDTESDVFITEAGPLGIKPTQNHFKHYQAKMHMIEEANKERGKCNINTLSVTAPVTVPHKSPASIPTTQPQEELAAQNTMPQNGSQESRLPGARNKHRYEQLSQKTTQLPKDVDCLQDFDFNFESFSRPANTHKDANNLDIPSLAQSKPSAPPPADTNFRMLSHEQALLLNEEFLRKKELAKLREVYERDNGHHLRCYDSLPPHAKDSVEQYALSRGLLLPPDFQTLPYQMVAGPQNADMRHIHGSKRASLFDQSSSKYLFKRPRLDYSSREYTGNHEKESKDLPILESSKLKISAKEHFAPRAPSSSKIHDHCTPADILPRIGSRISFKTSSLSNNMPTPAVGVMQAQDDVLSAPLPQGNVVLGEDNCRPSPAHSSATLDKDEDDTRHHTSLDEIEPALDEQHALFTRQTPIATGISVTTTTVENGSTTSLIHTTLEALRQYSVSGQGVEIVTKTVKCEGGYMTTTRMALVSMVAEMSVVEVGEEDALIDD